MLRPGWSSNRGRSTPQSKRLRENKGNEHQHRRPCTIIEPQTAPRPRTACRKKEPLGRLRATLFPFVALAYVFRLPPRCTCCCLASNAGVLQELKDRLRGPIVPQLSHCRCSRVLHPQSLPTLLHSLCLCAVHARHSTKK